MMHGVLQKNTGGCQCGSIRYELIGTPQMLYVCHCTDCQHQSSSAFGMSLRMDPHEIDFSKSEKQLQAWLQIDRNQYRCFNQEPDSEDELRRLWQAQT